MYFIYLSGRMRNLRPGNLSGEVHTKSNYKKRKEVKKKKIEFIIS